MTSRGGRPPALTAEQVEAARRLRGRGLSLGAIARELGCGKSTVGRALQSQPAMSSPAEEVRSWPPPADGSTVWRVARAWDPEAQRFSAPVRVRPVRLWGRTVEVDEEGRVLCTHCHRLVDVVELGSPGNRHPVGILRPGGSREMPGNGAEAGLSPVSRRVVEWRAEPL